MSAWALAAAIVQAAATAVAMVAAIAVATAAVFAAPARGTICASVPRPMTARTRTRGAHGGADARTGGARRRAGTTGRPPRMPDLIAAAAAVRTRRRWGAGARCTCCCGDRWVRVPLDTGWACGRGSRLPRGAGAAGPGRARGRRRWGWGTWRARSARRGAGNTGARIGSPRARDSWSARAG